MKFSTSQALQLTVAAHNQGELPKAERFNKAILDSKGRASGNRDPDIVALANDCLGSILRYRGDLVSAKGLCAFTFIHFTAGSQIK